MRHSVRARFLQTLVCAVCALASPAPALAAGGSPVHVDPSSPVAKEYALPLATARGAPAESGQGGKLFGSGIKHADSKPAQTVTLATPPPSASQVPPPTSQVPPPVTTTPATTTTTTPAPKPHRRRPVHVTTVTLPTLTAATTTREVTASATPAAYRVLRPGSGSGLLWMILAAVVVIALGSAGGIVLSRRR
jgi:hypothetical protein